MRVILRLISVACFAFAVFWFVGLVVQLVTFVQGGEQDLIGIPITMVVIVLLTLGGSAAARKARARRAVGA